MLFFKVINGANVLVFVSCSMSVMSFIVVRLNLNDRLLSKSIAKGNWKLKKFCTGKEEDKKDVQLRTVEIQC